MKTLSRTATAAILAFPLLALPAAPVLAQQSRAEDTPEDARGNWYQVHLAVFGHRSETGEYEEVWRNKLQLKYPQNLIRLKSRERYLADLCGLTPNPANDSGTGKNRLLDILERVDSGEGYNPEDVQEAQQPVDAASLDPACKGVRPDLFPPDDDEIANTNAAAVVASAESLLSEDGIAANKKGTPAAELTPYVLGDNISDEEFSALVKKLSGAYRYRLLFSGSWPQALQARKQAAALLIEGGDAVGQHHELEGYIRIGLERYLHIDTDLWLSKFSEQRPAPRRSDYEAAGNDYSAARQTTARSTYQGSSYPDADTSARRRLSEFPALPIPFPVNDRHAAAPDLSADSDTPSEDDPDTRTENTHSDEDRNQPFRPSSNLDVLSADDSSYFVDRTVVMRQNRRMRSGEVHYLDHPMFGVLIKITPIAAESDDDSPSNDVSQR